MEGTTPSHIIKDLNFGDEAKSKIITGVGKLAQAVKSTLGASGKCVILEDDRGNPVITKDGVTVAESVVLYDPVENMGATLIKEAARNTVREAGDGTTTATVLAEALIKEVNKEEYSNISIRDIKDGISSGLTKVNNYLDKIKIDVEGDMLNNVAAISCNNDIELGSFIAKAYSEVGKDGTVLMENSETDETHVQIVDGVQFNSPLTSPNWITDIEKSRAELKDPLVLIVSSKIENVRKIQTVLEYAIKKKRALLIVGTVEQQVKAALMMNKVKGVIKVNVIDPPGFGPTRKQTLEDLAFLTGAAVINEELGDDMDILDIKCLGEAEFAVTDSKNTVIKTYDIEEGLQERIDLAKKAAKNEKNEYLKKNILNRVAMLTGKVGIVKVGANSKVELKEKRDRIEDAIYATQAALKEGIVPGGGIALLNAAQEISALEVERILMKAIRSPYNTILDNAGIYKSVEPIEGVGVDVKTGEEVNMIEAGIIDPVLVTKSALKYAVSVVNTVISADCVISNMRGDASN